MQLIQVHRRIASRRGDRPEPSRWKRTRAQLEEMILDRDFHDQIFFRTQKLLYITKIAYRTYGIPLLYDTTDRCPYPAYY
jgi:hypothetical protein